MTPAWTLPPGWSWVALKRLAAIPVANGLGEATDIGQPEWPRYVRTSDIADPWLLRDDVRASLPPAVAAQARLCQGDLLLCSAGSLDVFHLFTSSEPACFAGYLTRFRADSAKADTRYVTYCAASAPFRWQVGAGAVRSTIDNYSASKYANTYIAVPAATSTQRLVADFLDREVGRIDELSAQILAFQKTLQEHPRLVFDRVVTEARTAPLRYCLTDLDQGWSPECDAEAASEGEWGVLKVGCVNYGRFRPLEHKRLPDGVEARERAEVRAGDLLMSRANTRELVGSTALVSHTAGRHLMLSDKLYRLRCTGALLPSFAAAVLQGPAIRDQIEIATSGASSSMQNISQDIVKGLMVPQLPLDEQERLVRCFHDEQGATNRVQEEATAMVLALYEYRDALITEAVTGKLDVRKVSEQQLDESAHAATEGERSEVLSA